MQTTLDAFVARPPADAAQPDEYLWDRGPQRVVARIYLYTCATTGVHVYVGQTIQPLAQRDAGHRHGAQTVFDRAYVHEGQFVLTELDCEVFDADVQSADDDAVLLAQAEAWLNEREVHRIDEHSTFDPTGAGPGLNQTRGGQGGALAAYVQAARRRSHQKWRDVYAPGCEQWMRDHNTDSLLHVKQRDTVAVPAAKGGVLPIGRLFADLRPNRATGEVHTATPAAWRAWLDERGMAWDYEAAMWERVRIPGCEQWMRDHNADSLLHVKQSDTVAVPAAEGGVLRIGQLFHHLRPNRATGEVHTATPAHWRAWLDERGMAWDYEEAMWERVRIPGCEQWMRDNNTDSLLHVRRSDTVAVLAAEGGVLRIGWLINNWRQRSERVPAERRAWLNARGMLWHTTNVAQHLGRALQPERLPATAQELAADAEVVQALAALLGTGAFGAASESLVELEARFLGDYARL